MKRKSRVEYLLIVSGLAGWDLQKMYCMVCFRMSVGVYRDDNW